MTFNPNDSRYASAVGAWLSENFEPQFTSNRAVLAKMEIEGAIKYGASYLVQALTSEANPSVAGVSNFNTGITIPSDKGLSAVYTWSWYQGLTVVNKAEEAATNTEHEMVDLLEARLADTIESFAEVITTDLFSTTIASQSKINGLRYAIDAPTSTSPFGTIERNGSTYWKSIVETYGTPTALTMSLVNGMYNRCTKGTGPTMIVMPQELYGAYESLLLTNTRYATDQKLAQAGFEGYLHKGATVFFDERLPFSGSPASGTILYINGRDVMMVFMNKKPNAEPVQYPDRLVKGYLHWQAAQLVAKRLNRSGRQNGVKL